VAALARINLKSLGWVIILGALAGWLLGNVALRGALLRNLGFLALNESRAPEPADADAAAYRAARLLTEATRLDPRPASPWRALGYLHLSQGQENEALLAWQQFPAVATELIAQGQAAEAAGQPEEALAWYRRATAVAPQDPESWLFLGLAHEQRGDWSAAEATYLAGLDAQSAAATANSDLFFRLARVYANQTWPVNYVAVLDASDRAIQLDRFEHDWNRVQNRYFRGVALQELGRGSEALAEFEWVVGQLPDDYWALVRLGQLTWETKGDARAAEEYLLSALRARRDNKSVYLALGEVYWETGRQDEAVELYRAVLRLDPADATAAARAQGE
jgi:tetratricopeptide (TPR) repeat protein